MAKPGNSSPCSRKSMIGVGRSVYVCMCEYGMNELWWYACSHSMHIKTVYMYIHIHTPIAAHPVWKGHN